MVLAVIPARYASTRFPGKPLVQIAGKSMIQRVYEQVGRSKIVEKTIVATDDERIFDHVRSFGGEVAMTKAAHPSGTDRCAEIARQFPSAQFILNVQGDEPFIQAAQIDLLAQTLLLQKKIAVVTLVKRLTEAADIFNPNVVKAVFSETTDEALYFSRHPIPFLRGTPPEKWPEQGVFYKHIGLYGFRRSALLKIARLKASPLEKSESLEQLRWLENGLKIAVAKTTWETFGIDTPEDLANLPPFLFA